MAKQAEHTSNQTPCFTPTHLSSLYFPLLCTWIRVPSELTLQALLTTLELQGSVRAVGKDHVLEHWQLVAGLPSTPRWPQTSIQRKENWKLVKLSLCRQRVLPRNLEILEIERRFWRIATAVGLLGCSLEVMTKSIFSNETAQLQRYFKDNELS